MDIVFIDPPYKALKGIGSSYGYSLNVTSLAAFLRQAGLETAVITGNLLADLPVQEFLDFDVKKYAEGQKDYEKALNNDNHEIWQRLYQHIERLDPMAVGITCLSPAKDLVDKIVSIVKEADRDIQVITGGHHPTFCPHEILQNTNIDFAVRGEGEIPLLQLIKVLNSNKKRFDAIPGIAFRDKENIVINPDGEMIQDLDILPLAARDLVVGCDYSRLKGHYVSTARGCPYSCTFCSDRRLWLGKVRRRSVEKVKNEIKDLMDEYDAKSVDIVDGTFTYDLAYLREFCHSLINEDINIKWRCTARYDNINKEMLNLLKKAHCAGLYFGLESGSERMLKNINKKITINDIIKASELVRESGIKSITSVLLGLPNEDRTDIESTLRFMKKLKTDLFDINLYVPLPGTDLYDQMSKEEREHINWRKVGFKSFDSYFTKRMSYDELKKYILEAYDIAEEFQYKFKKQGGWDSKASNTV